MKKVLSSILISFIIFANLLAPFSVGWGKSGVEVKKNEVKAEDAVIRNGAYTFTVKEYGTKATLEVSADFNSYVAGYAIADVTYSLIEIKTNTDGTKGYGQRYGISMEDKTANKDKIYTGSVTIEGLTVSTPYEYEFRVTKKNNINMGGPGPSSTDDLIGTPNQIKINFTTSAQTTTQGQTVVTGNGKVVNPNNPPINARTMPACSITGGVLGDGTFTGCIAQAFYYVVFVPTSYLFALSGVFFDSTFAYSVQDTSYRSVFVVQGWGLVRDICNLFFIFVLLYVAIGTTLSLHSMKTKETIINVVIIGLFINFSLFATQVIIDASNISARVFYNSDAIKLDEKGANGVAKATPGLTIGADGIIPLSAGIVNKVNPQNIILHSKEVNNIPATGQSSIDAGKDGADNLDAGTFILIVILASAVNIVGFIVFLIVGMLFVTRIVGLWIAMIVAPLAFFTYILPEEMAGIKMIGWKNWWPETLKLAFLAPVFMFFMYLILKFLSLDLISDIAGKGIIQDGLGYFISILMPFAFIMVLLMKAKDIAKGMAGDMGEFATKMGSAVGGAALGGAVGLGAMAMRGTIGRYGNFLSQSEKLKEAEAKGGLRGFGARMLLKGGEKAGAGSFDARNTKAGAAAGKGLGVDMGKAKEGGYTKMKSDQIAAAQKRAKELELGENSHEKQELNKQEALLKRLQNENSHDIQQIEGKLKGARQRVDDANKAYAIDPSAENKEKANKANMEVRQLNADKSNITSGGLVMAKDADGNIMHDDNGNGIPDGSGRYHTLDGKITETAVKNARKEEADAVTNLASVQATVTNEGNAALAARTAEIQTINQKRLRAEATARQATQDAITAASNAPAIAAQAVADALAAAIAAENLALTQPTNENKAAAIIARTAANNAPAEAAKFIADTKRAADNASLVEQKALADAQQKEQDEINNAQTKYLESTNASNDKLNKAQISATNAANKAAAAITASAGGMSKSMNDIEYKDIPDAHHHLEQANNRRKTNIANNLESTESKVFNMIVSGGEYSRSGANQAAHAIRMDVKTEGSGH